MGKKKNASTRRARRTIKRLSRENTYTLIGHKGQVLRGRVLTRERSLILIRVV